MMLTGEAQADYRTICSYTTIRESAEISLGFCARRNGMVG